MADESNLAFDNYSVLSNSMQGTSPADTQMKIKIEVSQERGTESLLGPKGISELDTSPIEQQFMNSSNDDSQFSHTYGLLKMQV